METQNTAPRNDEVNDDIDQPDAPLLGRITTTTTLQGLPWLIFYFSTIHFLLAFCQIVQIAPLIKLFEESLCLTHFNFPPGGVDEALCKIPEIQIPLATIRGWKALFDTIPVLLVAIPFGKLGDSNDRSRIIAVAMVGVIGSLLQVFVVCAYPEQYTLQWVYLSSSLLLCGGGLNSASAFMWAMAAEAIPSDKRSYAFYHIFSAFYIAELVASFTATVTTDISPWIPCGLALGSAVTCLLLLIVMPPLWKSLQSRPFHATTSSLIEPGPCSQFKTAEHSLVNGFRSAILNRNILFTMPVFLVGIIRYNTLNVLIQYASVRFGMKISSGSIFYTETALINIFLFAFLIPRLTTYVVTAYGVQPQTIDLFLVRLSLSLMCIGALLIGLAQSKFLLPIGVLIFASGFGSRVVALSLVSCWISDDSKSTIYAAIVVLESIGHSIGDPGMLQILAVAMAWKPFWWAAPFFVAAGLYFIAILSASFVRLETIGNGIDERGVVISCDDELMVGDDTQ